MRSIVFGVTLVVSSRRYFTDSTCTNGFDCAGETLRSHLWINFAVVLEKNRTNRRIFDLRLAHAFVFETIEKVYRFHFISTQTHSDFTLIMQYKPPPFASKTHFQSSVLLSSSIDRQLLQGALRSFFSARSSTVFLQRSRRSFFFSARPKKILFLQRLT